MVQLAACVHLWSSKHQGDCCTHRIVTCMAVQPCLKAFCEVYAGNSTGLRNIVRVCRVVCYMWSPHRLRWHSSPARHEPTNGIESCKNLPSSVNSEQYTAVRCSTAQHGTAAGAYQNSCCSTPDMHGFVERCTGFNRSHSHMQPHSMQDMRAMSAAVRRAAGKLR